MRVLTLVALILSACSYGIMPPEEAGAPPSKPPLGAAPEPPETAPPPPPRNAEAGCPGIDPQGQCRGSVAIWCEGGQLRSVDCASIGRVCEQVDEATGFYCGRPAAAPPPEDLEENPGDPPNEGAPAPAPEEGAPPPEDDDGAPPPPAGGPPDEDPGEGAPPPPPPNPPEEAPDPPAEEGAPDPPAEEPAPDPCGGVTYLGHCEGDIAVWCDGAQVHRDDCTRAGQTCGYVDDETGYYCREAAGAPAPPAAEPAPPPPDEGAPPPEADGCGGIDYFGVCDDAVVVYCSNGALVRHDCAPSGTTCGWVNDDIGNWCVEL